MFVFEILFKSYVRKKTRNKIYEKFILKREEELVCRFNSVCVCVYCSSSTTLLCTCIFYHKSCGGVWKRAISLASAKCIHLLSRALSLNKTLCGGSSLRARKRACWAHFKARNKRSQQMQHYGWGERKSELW
jgi:hypothetical protein